jgi:hypothetical protein
MLLRKKFRIMRRCEWAGIYPIYEFPGERLPVGMSRQRLHPLDLGLNGDDGAALSVEQYVVDHPGSPSAVRRPKVFRQGETFIVLLGRDMQHGIVGLGSTVENAFRAFDLQHGNALRPPEARSVAATARADPRKWLALIRVRFV